MIANGPGKLDWKGVVTPLGVCISPLPHTPLFSQIKPLCWATDLWHIIYDSYVTPSLIHFLLFLRPVWEQEISRLSQMWVKTSIEISSNFILCDQLVYVSQLPFLLSNQCKGPETYPAEWHYVESVATTIDLVKEVTVGVMRCVVYLQLTARIPVDREWQGGLTSGIQSTEFQNWSVYHWSSADHQCFSFNLILINSFNLMITTLGSWKL